MGAREKIKEREIVREGVGERGEREGREIERELTCSVGLLLKRVWVMEGERELPSLNIRDLYRCNRPS